jgi:hypothetical protein
VIIQLDPPLPLQTPKGAGLAHLVVDYGVEADLIWVVFIDATGEVWSYRNQEVRAQKNVTMGRTLEGSPETLESHFA